MRKNLSDYFWLVVLFIICIMSIASYLLYETVNEYKTFTLEQEDQSLDIVLNSVDAGLEDICERYLKELLYTTASSDFLKAEDKWIHSGQAEDLLFEMKNSIVGKDEDVRSVIAVFRGRLVLSSDKKMDYWLSSTEKTESGIDMVVCADDDLNPYIAFVQYKEDITYAVLMDPLVFYEKVEKNSGLKAVGDMILTDADHAMFLYRDENNVVAELLSEEGQMENPLLQILLYAHMKKKESIDFYEVKEGPYKEAYKARVAICPDSLSQNRYFSIGVLHNQDAENALMKKALTKMVCYAGMIVVGFFVLLYYLLQIYRQDARNRREMQVLIAKKEAMEALNEQTKEFAHHQRLETIGQLTSGVAHEFNNLLTPIMGYSLMTMEQIPPEQVDIYDNLIEIYEAANQAKTLISRLSDLSRKNTAVTMHYVNPNEMMKKALAMANTSKPKIISLMIDFRCKDVWIYGNETQLTQMMINLILNAFHAIGEKEGKVTIKDYVEGDQVFFEITDDGEGMTEEVKKKLFEPFFTTKSQGRGTGLGLAIVMQTVEEHKGNISVESELGKGSTFYLSFPVATIEDDEE